MTRMSFSWCFIKPCCHRSPRQCCVDNPDYIDVDGDTCATFTASPTFCASAPGSSDHCCVCGAPSNSLACAAGSNKNWVLVFNLLG